MPCSFCVGIISLHLIILSEDELVDRPDSAHFTIRRLGLLLAEERDRVVVHLHILWLVDVLGLVERNLVSVPLTRLFVLLLLLFGWRDCIERNHEVVARRRLTSVTKFSFVRKFIGIRWHVPHRGGLPVLLIGELVLPIRLRHGRHRVALKLLHLKLVRHETLTWRIKELRLLAVDLLLVLRWLGRQVHLVLVVVVHGLVADIELLTLGLLCLNVGRVREEINGVVFFAWIGVWQVHLMIINSK